MSQTKGSTWRKWDLHIHTPASLVNNYKKKLPTGDVWEDFIKELENLPPEFAVLGINDYLFIDGYERLKKEKEENNRLQNIDMLIPVIEFRIKKFAGSSDNLTRVNFHVMFSPDIPPNIIQQHFLNVIPQHYDLSPKYDHLKNEWHALATKESLMELGAKIKATVPTEQLVKYGSDIQEGFNNINFDEVEIKKVLNSSHYFKGKYFTAIGKTEWADIKWTDQSIAEKKNIINSVDFVFISSYTVDDFLKSHKHLTDSKVNNSLMDCSDAHNFSASSEKDRIGKCFTWIKGNTTFEGLRQVLYEPELRIAVQEEDPSSFETYSRVENLKVSLPEDLKILEDENEKEIDFCLRGQIDISFSNNLTCIIGGRGSGKSTLLHLMSNTLNEGDALLKIGVDSPLQSLVLDSDPLREIRQLTTASVPIDTEIYLQNQIEKYAKDVSGMSELIERRLSKLSELDPQHQSLSTLLGTWEGSLEQLDRQLRVFQELTLLKMKREEINKHILTLQQQTQVIKSIEYIKFQDEIKRVTQELHAFDKYRTEFLALNIDLGKFLTELTSLQWTEAEGKEDVEVLVKNIKDTRISLNSKFNTREEEFFKQKYNDQLQKVKNALREYLQQKGLSPENIEDISSANERIKRFEVEKQTLDNAITNYQEIYNKCGEVIGTHKSSYEEYVNRYQELFSSLTDRLSGVETESKKISFLLKGNFEHLKAELVRFIKSHVVSPSTLQDDEIRKVFFTDDEDMQDKLIKSYVEKKDVILEHIKQHDGSHLHKKLILEAITDPSLLEQIHLLIVKEFYSIRNIQIQTKFGEKSLQNTSFGERCGIVIAIILAAGTNPVVIDQPEDHLDSRFVVEVLVPLIRMQKANRQIVFVTRDANIAVGADAELMIIMAQGAERTEIMPATIEDEFMREKYIWILDGGKEAFMKREDKYGMKNNPFTH